VTASGEHAVTIQHLRRLATTDKASLFADCGTLIDTEDGILAVPFRVVADALNGNSKLKSCRLLYDRTTFTEDGVVIGAEPVAADGSDLDERLAVIAAGINGNEPAATMTEGKD